MSVSQKMQRLYAQARRIFCSAQMLIITGSYWGDEGKGKIVDFLSHLYDLAVRYSGGAGAGHTLVTPEGKKFVGHLIPCGIAQGIRCVLARGVFFDLKRFIAEFEDARRVLGKKLPPIWVDKYSPLWTPWHELFERWLEHSAGGKKVGTTGKAIGPLAGLKVLRCGPQVHHLYQSKALRLRLQGLYRALKPDFDAMVKAGLIKRQDIPLPIAVEKALLRDAAIIKSMVTDTAHELSGAYTAGLRILFEAAQAPGLDIDLGTWPYVSSGHSVAGGAPLGSGLPLKAFAKAIVLMVMKALPTRVGEGPFPSEIWDRKKASWFAKMHPNLFKNTAERNAFLRDKLQRINDGRATMADWSQYFQVLGYELGATTGRGRSVGFMDLMWLHYVIRINGPQYFALTRFDMLSGIKKIPVVIGYLLDDKQLSPGMMPDTDSLSRIRPVYEFWEGWDQDITGITDWNKLPAAAKRYIWKLEKRLGVPILLIGTGPERDAIIIRPDVAKRSRHKSA
ncbi:MAG: adenylosuccinate synthetase [Candidatus Kerfeldbacteria bacterium]|nr:adenylosuccinate synthetase [Candidatus Kerfeldbacteria bacterium]